MAVASTTMHLAIAKKYMEKNGGLNYKEFIRGTVYPDAGENSFELHYPLSNVVGEFADCVYDKVNLYAFLVDHPKLDDFELGYFLHLVTDYLFFRECFDREYVMKSKRDEFYKELYHTYDCLDLYLFIKYNVTEEDYSDYPDCYSPGIPYEECLISKGCADNFIERVSSIDLDRYINKILEFKGNVEP